MTKRTIAFLSIICILLISITAYGEVRIAPSESNLDTSKELLHLYAVDLTGGDCMLLTYKDKNLLVDLGKSNHFDAIDRLLKKQNIKNVEVFNTHPHRDHIDGIFELVEKYNVEAFYTAFPDKVEKDGKAQAPAISMLREKNIPVYRVHDGEKLNFDKDISIDIMQNVDGSTINEQSAMLYIKYNNAKLLLTADISWFSQQYFAEKYGDKIKADILKAPHHGLENLRTLFAKSVDPEFVFITNNTKYTEIMRSTLRRKKIPFMYAAQGIIHMAADGENWYVEQFKND